MKSRSMGGEVVGAGAAGAGAVADGGVARGAGAEATALSVGLLETGTRAGAAAAAGRVAWAAGSPAGFEGPRESGIALATGLAAVKVAPGALRIVGFAGSVGVVSSSSMIGSSRASVRGA